MSGIFVISLDFELFWGVRDTKTKLSYGTNILGAREAIPKMLDLFEEYGVHTTWATVGFLFAPNKEELKGYLPTHKPRYANSKFNPYPYLETEVGSDENTDPFHFGAALIEKIKQTPGQEIATHTFSHYYCLEDPQSSACFIADLNAAAAIAKGMGYSAPQSLVFPRNQYDQNHLDLLTSCGIRAYRGNPNHWLYEPRSQSGESIFRRALRLIDTYVPLSGSLVHHFKPGLGQTGPMNIPASLFLRPYSAATAPFERLKVQRIKRSMRRAAKNGGLFHLWWHPHNFGRDTDENLANLMEILETYQYLKSHYGFRSLSMGETADFLMREQLHVATG